MRPWSGPSTWLRDKVGRYEVPRADIATLKKIANPLKLGVMHEAAFVLGHEWPQLMERKAGRGPEVSVRQLREWIDQEQPGLPNPVRDLVVVCYAIQADKAWIRAGQQITMPDLTKLADDMVLRGQELPTEDEFEGASVRAHGSSGYHANQYAAHVPPTRSPKPSAARLGSCCLRPKPGHRAGQARDNPRP